MTGFSLSSGVRVGAGGVKNIQEETVNDIAKGVGTNFF